MIIWGIGIFFLIAGIMMWPYGHMCLIVGAIICIAKFFSQYKSVEGYQWTQTFNNSSFVNELCDYIDRNHVHNIEIRAESIKMDSHVINFSTRGISELSMNNCQLLAMTIKNKIKYGDIYKLSPLVEVISGYVSGHERPIGMTETFNGNYVFDYGDSSDTMLVGYSLSVELKQEKVVKKSNRSEWR